MQQIPLAASRRQQTGKGYARKMRAQDMIPAVIYSGGQPAEMLAVARNQLEKVLRQAGASTAFLALSVDDAEPRTALLKELQTDHLGRKLLHVDFYEVRPDQELSIEVPLSFEGEAKGAESGGMISIATHKITLKGRAADLPDSVVVDLSDLEVGESIHLRELPLPEGVQALGDDDLAIVSCYMPAVVEEEEPEEGEEAEGEAAAAAEEPAGDEQSE